MKNAEAQAALDAARRAAEDEARRRAVKWNPNSGLLLDDVRKMLAGGADDSKWYQQMLEGAGAFVSLGLALPSTFDKAKELAKGEWEAIESKSGGKIGREGLTKMYEQMLTQCSREGAASCDIEADVGALVRMSPLDLKWQEFSELWEPLVEAKARSEKDKVEGLSKVDISDAKSVFEMLDEDKSGFLEKGELVTLCKWLHEEVQPPLPDNQIQAETDKMVTALDTDSDGKVSFEEFEVYFLKEISQLSHLVKMVQRHKVPDIDHSVPPVIKEKLDAVSRCACLCHGCV